jgi:Ni/Co efflux regulator RcnB
MWMKRISSMTAPILSSSVIKSPLLDRHCFSKTRWIVLFASGGLRICARRALIHLLKSHATVETGMRRLFYILLLASAAAAPAIAAAPPAQNTTAAQTKGTSAKPAKTGERAARSQTEAVPPRTVQRRRVTVEQRRTTVVQPTQTHSQVNVQRTTRMRPPIVSRTPRMGTQPPLRTQKRVTPRPRWNYNWRNNRTYDWNHWRRNHRSLYRVHRYRDPYGWAYQLFSVGWRIWPGYYGSAYRINDPWMYRLPPAPPGTRWIRYYNDALLVDTWTGEVIDVIHNFFW